MGYKVIFLNREDYPFLSEDECLCEVCREIERNVIEPVALFIDENEDVENLSEERIRQLIEKNKRLLGQTKSTCIFHCQKENEVWIKNFEAYINYLRKEKPENEKTFEEKEEDLFTPNQILWDDYLVNEFWKRIRTYRFCIDYWKKEDTPKDLQFIEENEEIKDLLQFYRKKIQNEPDKYDFRGVIFPRVQQEKTQVSAFPNAISVKYFSFWFEKEQFYFSKIVDFKGSIFVDEMLFESVRFVRIADFIGSTFKRKIEFKVVNFKNNLYFNNSKFKGDVLFFKVIFEKLVGFNEAIFWTKLQFTKDTEFKGEANFKETKFGYDTDVKSNFHKKVDFWKSEFAGNIDFSGVTFFENSDFREIKVLGNAFFQNTIFKKKADFWKAKFSGAVDFSKAEFSKSVNFKEVKFSDNSDFSNANFSDTVIFVESQFSGIGDFNNVKFLSEVDFSKFQFSGAVDFSEAKFSKSVNFKEAKFSDNSDFSNAKFFDEVTFVESQFSGAVDFSKAEFSKSVNFKEAKFLDIVDFRESKFYGKIELSNAKFNGGINFVDVNIKSKYPVSFSGVVLGKISKLDFNNQKIGVLDFSEIKCLPESYIEMRNIKVEKVKINNFINNANDFIIIKLKIIENDNKPEIEIKESALKSMRFFSCDFSKAKQIEIQDSSISSCEFLNTDWGEISEKRICHDLFFGNKEKDIKAQPDKARESYRQLKYIFDEQKNFIHGSEFYALEMRAHEKYLSELKKEDLTPALIKDKIVFKISKIASNYAQDWVKPLKWILFLILFLTSYNFLDWIYLNHNKMCVLENMSKFLGKTGIGVSYVGCGVWEVVQSLIKTVFNFPDKFIFLMILVEIVAMSILIILIFCFTYVAIEKLVSKKKFTNRMVDFLKIKIDTKLSLIILLIGCLAVPLRIILPFQEVYKINSVGDFFFFSFIVLKNSLSYYLWLLDEIISVLAKTIYPVKTIFNDNGKHIPLYKTFFGLGWIALSYLIYQLVVSLRRKIRR